MIEEPFPDALRQLIVVLASKALVDIRDDPEMGAAVDELQQIVGLCTGTDTVLVARRAYQSYGMRNRDDAATDRTKALYRDPRFAPRNCNRCGQPYSGPSVYCKLECALNDA